VTVAACALLAVGCAPTPPRAPESVQHMLDRHAAAVLHHDEPAFLADVAPSLQPAQRQVFQNLAEVPLASWSYRLESSGPPARVQLRYRVKGYDADPVTTDLSLGLTRSAGRWRITSEQHTAAQLWDQGKVHVVRGTHSLVLGLGTPASLAAYAAAADRAVAAVRRVWGDHWARRVVLEVPGTLDQMAALLNASSAAYRGIAAVTTAELGSPAVPADRVIVNPEAFAELSGLGRQVVLTHEATHVATRAFTTSATPLWLSEGVADWTGYLGTGRTPHQVAPELARDVAAGKLPRNLPSNTDFGTTAAGLAQAYEGGWLACRLVADQWGSAKLTALYRAVNDRTTADMAMRRTLGVSLGAFTARWRAYVQKELA
jgi:hypothetical protein